MNKFINILWFIGDLCKGFAYAIKSVGPSYKEMQSANRSDKLISELADDARIMKIKKTDVNDENQKSA